MIDEKNLFDQPIKDDIKIHDNIWKNATGHGYDYAIGCFLNYSYFKEDYNMISINLSKQQVLDVSPRPIQQINFTGNLDWGWRAIMFFILEEAKEAILYFSQWTVRVLWIRCIIISIDLI